nr:GNAT family N-acetyltransferase [Variovorax sp. PCZ-1]
MQTLSNQDINELADVLIDVVEGGASVGFMLPITRERALQFWQTVASDVVKGERAVLVARDTQGVIAGTTQLILAMPDNQPHRADLAKMQVHRRARKQGLAQKLLHAAESWARELGKTVLVLDTVSGSDASRVYERALWQRVGEIPNYALWPQGGMCPTTYYFKDISK